MSIEPPPQVPSDEPPSAKWAIISIVCGAIALLGSACIAGIAVGIAGIISGFIHLRTPGASRPLAYAGIACSLAGIACSIAFIFIYIALVPRMSGSIMETRKVNAIPGAGLVKSSAIYEFESAWDVTIDSPTAIGIGDWTGDGVPEVLLSISGHAVGDNSFVALDSAGRDAGKLAMPMYGEIVESGRGKDGSRLLIVDAGRRTMHVFKHDGAPLWDFEHEHGIDDARMGDVDGDRIDEVIVGMNGGGGLRFFSSDGEELWKDMSRGNHWCQAILNANADSPAVILSSSADMNIVRYGEDGSELDVFSIPSTSIADFAVRRSDTDGQLQFITGDIHPIDTAVGFDESGKVRWQTTVGEDRLFGAIRKYSYGDLNGDKQDEWVFMLDADTFAVVSDDGKLIATLDAPPDFEAYQVLPVPDGRALLVAMCDERVWAYRLIEGTRPVMASPQGEESQNMPATTE
jgi:hypothetical protein